MLTVWEASTATFTVALSVDPCGTVEATVARESGDADITVLSGGILTFDSSNYSKPQTVTLAAAQDDDNLSGNALILITAPGFYSKTVSATEGEILFVDANAAGANNGTSWPDAFICLQDAFAVASDYAGVYEVRVAEGIYKPDAGGGQTPGDRQAAFHLMSGMTVYGGFPSGGGNWEARNPDLHETVLSGDLDGNDVDVNDPCDLQTEPTRAENSYHVVTGHDADAGSILDGFIITAGNANGSSQNREASGGGMYNDNGSPKVINCTFSNNSASSCGGGMSNLNGSDPTVTSCTFSGNCADYFGGGMDNAGSSPTVINCTFSGNAALHFGGGGMSNGTSSPTVTDCAFADNSGYSGGGMQNWGSSPTVVNCTFGGNSARYAGGMANMDGSGPSVSNCTFTGNSASMTGGGMTSDWFSSPTVTNCTFTGNAAGTRGGGVYDTVYGNPMLTNCTLSGNSAGELGGAMCNRFGSSPVLSNCILWDNTAPSGAQIYNDAGSSPAIAYSDVQDDASGIGNIDADPCFIEPGYWADANDSNCHVEPNHPNAVWIEGNYHLLASSPCIDAGDNNSVASDFLDLDGDGNTTEPIPWDLGGNARIADGGNDANSVVDMGAYEFFWPPMEVSMKLTPQTLNPASQGRWVKAHFVLPEGFTVEDVDATIPARITEPFEPDIESEYMNVFVNDSNFVEIEACFERAQFCAAAVDGNAVEVTAAGSLTSGQQFYGTDTVKITNNAFKHLADLASYWLEESCDHPDWCGGLDLDQDGALDFVDFALFDGCCVQAVEDK
jgi:hypothetical protein